MPNSIKFINTRKLPVERAKDAVCFLQWCGVRLVSSYTVCFWQRGGVSLALSAIIYNIVKVKVSRWPVDPFDPLTRRPVDPSTRLTFSKKNPSRAIARSTYIHRRDVTLWPVDLSTCWPFRKRTPQAQLRGPPTYTVEMPCSKRRRIRLCCRQQQSKRSLLCCVAWGWRIYNIVESESDPLTRRPIDLFDKEPLKGKWEVNLHTPTKFGEDPSNDLRGDSEHTNTATNVAWIIVWLGFNYILHAVNLNKWQQSVPNITILCTELGI